MRSQIKLDTFSCIFVDNHYIVQVEPVEYGSVYCITFTTVITHFYANRTIHTSVDIYCQQSLLNIIYKGYWQKLPGEWSQ